MYFTTIKHFKVPFKIAQKYENLELNMIRDNAKQYNENYKISLRKIKDD